MGKDLERQKKKIQFRGKWIAVIYDATGLLLMAFAIYVQDIADFFFSFYSRERVSDTYI